GAADRVTVNSIVVVPVCPSATEELLTAREGEPSGGPGPLLRSTETLSEPFLADATSGPPMPLKLPTVTPTGFEPTGELTGSEKAPGPVPVPLPSSTLMVPLSELAVTMSVLPSPLKSARPTDWGCVP